MTSRSRANRPFKYGPNDRREFIVLESEITIRVVNDGSGNPIYVARAKVGTQESEDKWQISYISYDSNDGVTSVLWPENSESNASTEYEFVYDDATNTTISGITQANPGVVTMAANPFTDGDVVIFENMGGMTELEFNNTTARMYIVANGDATTFEITDLDGNNVNTSGYGAFSAGEVTSPDWANYTYS